MSDERVERLEDALGEYVREQGYLVRWALVLEVERVTDGGGRVLMHRSRDAAADRSLNPWDEMAMHRAAALVAEQDLLNATGPPP